MDVRTETTCLPDTYVGCPAPPVDLPECEHGWELGNGTAVCATQQPSAPPLAATGADGGMAFAYVALGLAIAAVGLSLVSLAHAYRPARTRQRQIEMHAASLRAQHDALTEDDDTIERGRE